MKLANAAALSLVAILVFSPVGVATPVYAQMSQSEVEERLTCQCGCGLTLASCNHLQCGFRNPMREEITRRLGEGVAGEVIIEGFLERYGEKILSSPTTTGFNLLAWTGPYIAILIAGVLILWRFGFLSRGKSGNGGDSEGGGASASSTGDGEVISASDRQRIKRELGEV